jgi:hypothetical protein
MFNFISNRAICSSIVIFNNDSADCVIHFVGVLGVFLKFLIFLCFRCLKDAKATMQRL